MKQLEFRCETLSRLFIVVGATLTTLLSAQEVSSDSNQNTYEMGKMIVTPSRTASTTFEVPYTAEVISSEQIARRGYRTTPQMLRDVTGIMVQETAFGQGSPYIRGFTGFRNVFMVDGIRLNNSVFREGPNQYWNTVDPYSIDRLEVVKGPASVLYGSDAIGGAVNAITRGSSLYNSGRSYGGRAFFRTASAENSQIGRGEVQVNIMPSTQMLLGGTGKHYGDLIGGRSAGRLPGTGYDEWDADFKLEHQIAEDAKMILAYQIVRQNNVPRTHRTLEAESFAGSTLGSELQREIDQERQLAYAQYHRDNIAGFVDSMQFSLSWHQQNELRDRIRPASAPGGALRRDLQGVDVGTLGIWSQMESETSIGNLLYGFDFYRDFVDSYSSRNAIQGPVGDDANYDLAGLFLQDTIDITDRWQTTLSGRGTYAAAEADSVRNLVGGGQTSVSDNWASFVGSARVLYRAIPNRLNLFAGIAQGFRAPNLSDLTRFDTARSGETEIPATDLDPEHYLTYEVGSKWANEKLSTELSFFYTDIKDQIVRFPTGAIIDGEAAITRDNVGDGFVGGVEFGLSYEFYPAWTLFGNTTFQQGEVDTFPTAAPIIRSEYLSRTMPWVGQTGIRWEGQTSPFWVEVMGIFAADADKLSTRDMSDTQRIPPGGTPGYAVMDLRAGWNLNDHLSLIAALDNVTNEDYRIHGSGQNSPGRSIIFSANATF